VVFLSSFTRESKNPSDIPGGLTQEQNEKFNQYVFIDVIKNCCSLENVVFKRIIVNINIMYPVNLVLNVPL